MGMAYRAARVDHPLVGVALSREVCLSLQLSALGLNSHEVAERLGLEPATVRRHIREAMVVLGATSKLEAVIRALQLGLISVPPPKQRPSTESGVGSSAP